MWFRLPQVVDLLDVSMDSDWHNGQAPGRQPGTARKEVVTVVRTAAEQEALRQKAGPRRWAQ